MKTTAPVTNRNQTSPRSPESRRAGEASGHDDQGGSRQSERRDYEGKRGERVEPNSSEARGGPSGLRYGEQTEAQRQMTDRQLREGNVGSQDRNDQSRDAFHPPVKP